MKHTTKFKFQLAAIAIVLSFGFLFNGGCKHKNGSTQPQNSQPVETAPYVPAQPTTAPSTTPTSTSGIPPIGPTFPAVINVPPPTAPSTTSSSTK